MKKNKRIIIIILLFLTGLTMFMLSNKATGFYHLYYLVFPPEDQYQPLVMDNFNFHEKNYTAKYKFKPKYRDIHEVGFTVQPNVLLSGWGGNKGYTFSGKLKVELFHENTLVDEAIVTKRLSVGFQKDNMDYISSVSLYNFPVPIKGFFLKETILRVTVVEPDKSLEKYKKDIDLRIRVSPIP
jgi:hypothetical protein